MGPGGRYMYLLQVLSGAERLTRRGMHMERRRNVQDHDSVRPELIRHLRPPRQPDAELDSWIGRPTDSQRHVSGRVTSFADGLEGVKHGISHTLNLMRKYCRRWVNECSDMQRDIQG